MSRTSKQPTCVTAGLLVCTGKDCRHAKGWDAMVDLAAGTPRAHEAPCQGVCKGPVIGFAINGTVRWFGRLKSAKQRSRVLAMATSGSVPKKLTDRESRSRRGRVRGAHRTHPLDVARAKQLLGR